MSIPLDPHYIAAFSIEDVLLDKDTGAPLSGGLVYFYEDNQRTVLKPVYQISGTSPNYNFDTQLPNPVVLSSIGTFQDALGNPQIPYFYPYTTDADGNLIEDLYFIAVFNSGGVPQFTREAVPYIGNTGGDLGESGVITNELSNPQFASVLFETNSPPYVYNFSSASSQVVNLAPDWDLVVTSPATATVTVQQITPAGSDNVITNPGTLLNINSAGVSTLLLRQRIYGSPNLWGGGNLAATFVAKAYSGAAQSLNLYYAQSNGALALTPVPLVAAELQPGAGYVAFNGTVEIPTSTSADTFPNAYIDIYFNIPPGIEFDITSVMVAFTGLDSITDLIYEEESNDRQLDHLFHYYNPLLEFKPIPSLLTAWDFPLNPAQIFLSSTTMTTAAGYIWDQTIGQSVVGNVAIVRNTVTGGIQATTANANEAFYYMQYLTGAQAQKFLNTQLAVNIDGFTTQAGGVANVQVYMFRGSSSAVFPDLGAMTPLTIGGGTPLAADGTFTLNNASGQGQNWTLIPRGDLGEATGTLSAINTSDYSTLNTTQDLQFSGWEITNATDISNTNKFCIVVTFSCPTTATVVTINSISVVPGEIPTRPAPQTADEVLRECQYYYERSNPNGVLLSTGSGNTPNALIRMMGSETSGSTLSFYTRSFGIEYKVPKVVQPAVTIFSITGDIGNVTGFTWTNGSASTSQLVPISGNWGTQNAGLKAIVYTSLTNSAIFGASASANFGTEAFALFHYEAEALLGIN